MIAQCINILSSFLHNTSACVAWMNPSANYHFSKGCSQSSCSGPFPWNVFLEELLRAFRTDYSELVAYADDMLVLTWGSTRPQLEKKSKYALSQLEDWVSNNGTEISIHKCQTITFSKHNIKSALKKNLKNRPPIIRINNINLKSVKKSTTQEF